ncbi:MAG: VCBS repeat-containing protein, partial [Planctomycetes bacterium]|nr:VCBS repeat-containing protein [Planctomycetota bacterium]
IPPSDAVARLCRVAAPEGWRIREVALHDLDGDDVADLVLALSGPSGARRLEGRVRRKDAPSFSTNPDRVVDLPRDVVAWAVADVHSDLGDEFVLFGASAAFSVRATAPEAERFAKLAAIDCLWQWPDSQAFVFQDGVRDIDGDGLDDLVVPGPGLARVLFQRRDTEGRATFARAFDLVVGEPSAATNGKGEVRQPGGRRSVSVSFGDDGFQLGGARKDAGTMLAVEDGVPAPQFHDWDGDGDLDALFLRDDALVVVRQEPRGAFAPGPALVLASPVVRDRSRALDLSFDVWSRDLDGDGRVDAIVAAGDRRAKDMRTQVQVFLQARGSAEAWDAAGAPLFGPAGTPSGLLVLAGLGRLVEVRDVDGDGRLDLVALSLKPDLLDQMRSAASEEVEVELYVFRGGPAGFERRPAFVQKVALPAAGGDHLLAFAGDVTGDGVAELFTRDAKDRLRVYVVKKQKDGTLARVERPLWELPIDAEAQIVLPGRLKAGAWDVLAWTGEGVTCASFR